MDWRWAFMGCKQLVEINLENVEKIGKAAFSDCYSLEEANLKHVNLISPNMFKNCDSLKSVIFNKDVWGIGEGVFLNCSNLSKVVWPMTCEFIEPFAFAKTGITQIDAMVCDQLHPVRIHNHAFEDCKKLSKVYIDVCNWNRFDISSKAFGSKRSNPIEFILSNCHFSTRFLTMKCDFMIFKDKVTMVGDINKRTKKTVTPELVKLATNSVGGGEEDEMIYDILTSRTAKVIGMNFTVDDSHLIPPFVMIDGKKYKVTEISDYAFAHFKDMTNIAISETVTYIGDGAFEGCKNLEVFVFGNPSVGKTTFKNCKKVWEWNKEGEYFIDVTDDYTHLK